MIAIIFSRRHQLGAGFAALMAGVIRTELGSYVYAFHSSASSLRSLY